VESATANPGLPLTGGCMCGAVRYEIDAPLEGAGYCHCTRCQRRTGGAASVSARTAPGSFRVARGDELIAGCLVAVRPERHERSRGQDGERDESGSGKPRSRAFVPIHSRSLQITPE